MLLVHPLFTWHKSYGAVGATAQGRPGRGVRVFMSKILLAEDDTDMRRFLVKALQNAGFDVTSYDNGLSAYQRLREEPFELLLTDIVMPEMDGIELARRAAELDPDIKIMFITGFAAVALNADSTAPKHAKVLSKPIHLRDLVNEVTKDAGGLAHNPEKWVPVFGQDYAQSKGPAWAACLASLEPIRPNPIKGA